MEGLMDLSGPESVSYEDAVELAETYSRIAAIYARIANAPQIQTEQKPPASAERTKASHSAYMLFAAEQRDLIRSENPNMTSQEQIEVISQIWKAISSDVRDTYISRIERAGSGDSSKPSDTHGTKKKEHHKTAAASNGPAATKKSKKKGAAAEGQDPQNSE